MATESSGASKRVVEETRKLYASLLSRQLDERQLARPPFKFIQELVKALLTETKILRDVYTPADFDLTKRNWDRRAKVDFVQKLIDFAANNKQPVANCVASRVVSGLEANKTNELLQSLAKIALIKRSATNERRPRTFVKPAPVPLPVAANSNRRANSPRTAGQARVARPVVPTAGEGRAASGSRQVKKSPEELFPGGRRKSSSPADAAGIAQPEALSRRQSRDLTREILATTTASRANNNKSANGGQAEQETQTQSRQTTTMVQIVSESDINKNIHLLKSSLKSLRSLVADVSQAETLLKESLDRLRASGTPPEREKEPQDIKDK